MSAMPSKISVSVTTHALTVPFDSATVTDAKGMVFLSNYEYLGRYTRWYRAIRDPILELCAKPDSVVVRALDERGCVLLPALAATLRATPAITNPVIITPTELRVSLSRGTGSFTEEDRSKQSGLFCTLRALTTAFTTSINDGTGLMGWFGAFGYDLVHQLEEIKLALDRDPNQRDVVLYLPDRIWTDKEEFRYEFTVPDTGATTVGVKSVACAGATMGREYYGESRKVVEKPVEPYADKVRRVKAEFKEGRLFECVLSQKFSKECALPPHVIFERIRERNPSPYTFFLNLGGGEYLIGASPEMYVRVNGRRVETCPISGTIRRGADAVEDARNIQKLLSDPKEESELVMCVDVDRNDKSRICVPGSVRVLSHRQIEMYSRLMHTVDHVEGIMLEGHDAFDAFLTHAWAVTLTGAPKPNALQYIENNEDSAREWYAGAFGWIGCDGRMDTGLTIRTVHLRGTQANVRAGATLLYEADPESEDAECALKASAFLDAMTKEVDDSGSKTSGSEAVANAEAKQVQFSASACEVADGPLGGRACRTLLVDYIDSFVHTIGNYLRQNGAVVTTYRYSEVPRPVKAEDYDLVVLSPGPGMPDDFGMPALLSELIQAGLPILGICLGMEAVVEYFGGTLSCFDAPLHGKTGVVNNNRVPGDTVFGPCADQFRIGHYHSFYAEPKTWPAELDCLVHLKVDGLEDIPMAVRHKHLPIVCTQFHPESIMQGESGTDLIKRAMSYLLTEAAGKRKSKAERELGRVVFTIGGYPTADGFVDSLLGLQDSGEVDVVEVGIPFNDPIADGPLIQELYAKVIADVPSVNFVLDLIEKARARGFNLKIILMGYCNTFFQGFALCGELPTAREGWDTRCKALNVTHAILVDYGDLTNPAVAIDIVPLMAENIDDLSFNALCQLRGKIIYCTNYLGVTGSGSAAALEPVLNESYLAKMRQLQTNGNQILMGFGIRNSKDFNRTADMYGCDMCVIGTAYLKELQKLVEADPEKMATQGKQGDFSIPRHEQAAMQAIKLKADVNIRLGVRAIADEMFGAVKPRPDRTRAAVSEEIQALLADPKATSVVPTMTSQAPGAALKICGFRTWENVIGAILENVDYFGFLMVPTSKRYFGEDMGYLEMCCAAVKDAGSKAVGVFELSLGVEKINATIIAVPSMQVIQLYGCGDVGYGKSAEIVAKLPGDRSYIFCTSAEHLLKDTADVVAVEGGDAFSGLCVDNAKGGTGESWDYSKAEHMLKPLLKTKKLWMAGGLRVSNAAQVLFADVVDVSSGAELPGFDGKSVQLIGQLYRQVKGRGDECANGGVPVRVGKFGGQFVSTLIQTALNQLECAYLGLCDTDEFRKQVHEAYREIAGRPTGLYKAERLSETCGDSATIWLKREDLLHTGAHKINNALFQIILAKKLGKKRIIAETGAGQHGVAVATVCARFNFPCTVYMGAVDVIRQNLNVLRMRMMGTTVVPVTSGDRTLSSAINEAMRDWATNINDTHYIIGSAVGPAPFPYIVRDAQNIIGSESREQFLEMNDGALPDAVLACVGGGSNAIGMFNCFIADKDVKIYGAEPTGAASLSQTGVPGEDGEPGVLHGAATMVMQDKGGRTLGTHSVSAGLDYAGVGPMHAYLLESGRADYHKVNDAEAIKAMHTLAREEGILAALETSHAIALAMRLASEPNTTGKHRHIVVSLSGRGDKDMGQAAHPTRMCWVGPDYVRACVTFFMEEPLQDEKMVFEFFDRFNIEIENENPICATILGEFRRQLMAKCTIQCKATDCADIVGTGGDKTNTHNISTPAAILAAATGLVQVMKHGNVSSTSNSGSADVLKSMGINLDAPNPEGIMDDCGVAFLFARKIHPAMAKFGPLRRSYKNRSIFNMLGPLCNPFMPSCNVFGVSNVKLGPIYAQIACEQMMHAKTMVVCSFDGVDKIQPNVATHVWIVADGEITYSVRPASTTEACLEGGGGPEQNARNITNVLSSSAPASTLRTFVVANAAAVLVLKKGMSWDEAEGVVNQSIADGRAERCLKSFVFSSNKQGPFTNILDRITSHVTCCGSLGAAAGGGNTTPPHALYDALSGPGPHVIGEVKVRSLTMPVSPHSPAAMLKLYGGSKVVAISIVTEPTFFGGSCDFVKLANEIAPNKVVLRKDFVLTEEQVAETPNRAGAGSVNNALLLIVAVLDQPKLSMLMAACVKHNVEAVVECVSEAEVDMALACGAKIIGINNRDLNTFIVDEARSERLYSYGKAKATDARFIAFSGIKSRHQMESSSLNAFLIGTTLMQSERPSEKLSEFGC